jgi:PAS domain S-box-containing protein
MPQKPTYEELTKSLTELQHENTRLKKLEVGFKESELRSRAVLDQTFQFIGLLTPEGTLIEANRTALQFSGVEASEVLGKPFWETPWWRHSPELQERLQMGVQRAAAGEFVRFEATHPGPDGQLETIDFSLKPVRDEAGNVVFLIPEGRNITDYKRTEEALRESEEALRVSEERFRGIASAAHDAIISVDDRGAITYWNQAAVRIFGYAEAEALGQNVHRLLAHPKYTPDYSRGFEAWKSTGKGGAIGLTRELIAVRRDGTEFPVELSLSSILMKGVWHAIALVRDVSARKQAERELAERTRALDMRVRHLRCLYAISRLLEQGNSSLEDVLPKILDLLPPAWQVPEITCARIVLDRRQYVTETFGETPWRLAREIMAAGAAIGTLEVFYLEERPDADEGPFLKEERTLLNVISERLGKVIERLNAEKELARARRREVEIAARIQRVLLLGTPPRDLPGMEFAALAIPSQGVDGDFYDFFLHSGQTVDVILGDVMGKGVSAALLGAGTKSHFFRAMTDLIPSLGHFPEPAEIVQYAHNRVVGELIRLESYLTLYYARFDVQGRCLHFVNCGHPRAIHFHLADSTCTLLEGHNMPIGFSEEEVYRQDRVPFEPGDTFLFYSDAVTEAQNLSGEFFGEERIVDCVRENGRLEAEKLIHKVLAQVVAFSHSEAFADDLTCVAVKIKEEA